MSFWSGVVQGIKDVDVLKEKEALADERERIQKYNEARDRKADERYNSQLELQQEQYLTEQERKDRVEQLAADELFLKYTPPEDGMVTSRSGAKTGAKTETGPTQRHVEEIALREGASPDALVPFRAFEGLGPKALEATLGEWQKWKTAHANTPGGPGSINEFISKAMVTFTPGDEVTDEQVAAQAALLNRDVDDVVAGMTVGDRIRRNLTKPGEFNINAPIPVDPLDSAEVTRMVETADKQMQAVLKSRFDKLRVLQKELEDTGEKDPELTARYVAAKIAFDGFGEDGNEMDYIEEFGANAILSVMINAPGSLGVNSFGISYNKAIDSKTYESEAEAVAAFREGDLLSDDYYVIGRDIFVVDEDRFNSAVNPTDEGSAATGEGVTGDPVGTLPDGFSETLTGNGDRGEEFVKTTNQGYVDITGLRAPEIKDAILNKGLKVGDSILSEGVGLQLTPKFMAFMGLGAEAEQPITIPRRGRNPSRTVVPQQPTEEVEGAPVMQGASEEQWSNYTDTLTGGVEPQAEQAVAEVENSPEEPQSVLVDVLAKGEAAKGEPLTEEEELAIGVEAIVESLLPTGTMRDAEREELILALQAKFGVDRVKLAFEMVNDSFENQQQ